MCFPVAHNNNCITLIRARSTLPYTIICSFLFFKEIKTNKSKAKISSLSSSFEVLFCRGLSENEFYSSIICICQGCTYVYQVIIDVLLPRKWMWCCGRGWEGKSSWQSFYSPTGVHACVHTQTHTHTHTH